MPNTTETMFIDNGEVSLHCVTSKGFGWPVAYLLIVPGMTNCADQMAEWVGKHLSVPWISVSIRGRGLSSAGPEFDYSCNAQASDVRAVMDIFAHARASVFGYSTGSVFSLLACAGSAKANNLIMGDFPPAYPGYTKLWADRIAEKQTKLVGTALPSVVRDAYSEDFSQKLREVTCPVTMIRGGLKDSLLSESVCEEIRQIKPNVRFITLPNSGHDLFTNDKEMLIDILDRSVH